MGAVVSILNNPATNFQNIPSLAYEDDFRDEDNLLMPPNVAEFQSEKNRFNTKGDD